MKKIITLIAALLGALISPQAKAWTYTDGDVLLIFRVGGSDDVEFDIGNVSQFTSLSSGQSVTVTGWDPALVSSTFGGLSGVDFVVASTSSTASWLTAATNVPTVNDVTPSAWHSQLYSLIDAIGVKPTNYNETPAESNAYVIQQFGDTASGQSSLGSYDYVVSGGGVNESYIAQFGGNVSFQVQGTVPASLGFWQIQPSGQNPKPEAGYVGTFTLDGTGKLTFVAGPPASTSTAAQIAVYDGSTSIANGQTSVINFGSVSQGGTDPSVTFTVTNTGTAALDVTNVSVPGGFILQSAAPATIAAGGSGTFTIELDSTSTGSPGGNVTIVNNSTNAPSFTFAVSGTVTGAAAPQIAVYNGAAGIANGQTTPVNFGAVNQGGTDPAVTFTITNSGSAALNVSGVSVPSGFILESAAPSTIAAGSSGSFTVELDSTSAGTPGGNVSIANNSSTFTFAVSGTVIAPSAPQIAIYDGSTLIPNGQTTAVNFGSVAQNGSGPSVTFTVTNSGAATLNVSNVTVPTGFTLTAAAPSTIAAGGSGTFTVQLNTAAANVFSGSVTVYNNSSTAAYVFQITGTVTGSGAQIALYNGSNNIANGQSNAVSFGSAALNGAGPVVTFGVTNLGGQTLYLTNVVVPAGYEPAVGLPASLAPGAGGIFTVQLITTNAGVFAGDVILSSSDPVNGLFVFPVTGQVTDRIIALAGNLAFGPVAVGSNAASVLTISNLGTATLDISNISYPSGFSGNWSNGPVAAGSAQKVTVTFAPTSATNYAGLIVVTSDAETGAGTLAVSGTGVSGNSGAITLSVTINGDGKVSKVDTNKIYKAGSKVTITATPVAGNIFTGWTGTITATNNPLVVTLEGPVILTANFEANPFPPFAGTYNGLFWAGGVTESNAGFLKTLILTSKGTYSASLLLNGAVKQFSGAFDADGQSTKSIVFPAPEGTVEVALSLATNTAGPVLTGSVSNVAGGWVATNLLAVRAAANASIARAYTLLIDADTNVGAAPAGQGYLTISTTAGSASSPAKATITGALADNTSISQSTDVSADAWAPLFVSLYKNKGLVLGWINLTNASSNWLDWVHPAGTGLFPAAFESTNEIALSPWTNSPAVFGALTNFTELGGTPATNVITNIPLSIGANGKATAPGFTFLLTPKTGAFTAILGEGTARATNHGVVLLNETNGGGYFVTKTNAGAVSLTP